MAGFIAFLIGLPMLVALILKSKYIMPVLALGVAAMGVIGLNYIFLIPAHARCEASNAYTCNSGWDALVGWTVIAIGIAMWIMAFHQRKNVTGLAASPHTKKAVVAVAVIIASLFALFFLAMLWAFTQA